MESIPDNLAALRRTITDAAMAAGRAADSVKLIAVSKFQPVEAVEAAIAAGQKAFGENRVQEAAGKFIPLRAKYPDIELHLIGPLQTNKAETAVELFDVIQTLDRPKLAEALAKAIRKTGKSPRLYVEVNIGHESQKAGIAPEGLGEFLASCRVDHNLTVSGLMCIPPREGDPAPCFQRLKRLADEHDLPGVSMGMSADYPAAIRCGATEVRIGTAIFGGRPPA